MFHTHLSDASSVAAVVAATWWLLADRYLHCNIAGVVAVARLHVRGEFKVTSNALFVDT